MLAELKHSFGTRIGSLLGDQVLGMIDFARYPNRATAWGGPFNGQPFRQALFQALIRQLEPAAIVETGTYLGTTTEFLAETRLPVFTIEANSRNYGFARAHLWRLQNVTLLRADSRSALRTLFDGPLRNETDCTLFFYLDAHWNDDLPLLEELDIVFARCPAAVVMVDDFRVPEDTAYGYDNYGSGKALTDDYISAIVAKHELVSYYPATPASVEGGSRRGCIILSNYKHHTDLSSMPLLRAAV